MQVNSDFQLHKLGKVYETKPQIKQISTIKRPNCISTDNLRVVSYMETYLLLVIFPQVCTEIHNQITNLSRNLHTNCYRSSSFNMAS